MNEELTEIYGHLHNIIMIKNISRLSFYEIEKRTYMYNTSSVWFAPTIVADILGKSANAMIMSGSECNT